MRAIWPEVDAIHGRVRPRPTPKRRSKAIRRESLPHEAGRILEPVFDFAGIVIEMMIGDRFDRTWSELKRRFDAVAAGLLERC